MRDFVKESATKQRREYHLYDDITMLVKDFPDSDEIDLLSFISEVESVIPRHYFNNIDVVYIGDFDDLSGRNAAYLDGAIYMTNSEPTIFDMLENIVHEVAHSLEAPYSDVIYADGKIANEFLGKRRRLQSILEQEGYDIPASYYENVEYDESFDHFLMDTVGYPLLTSLTMGLFINPYAATSLREYFASGFESFYLLESDDVKKISPQLSLKINYLHKLGE
tara:strand:- start:65249 stop:65914 length:666 start_codon:yes stop_codon:yes gene_type:complete